MGKVSNKFLEQQSRKMFKRIAHADAEEMDATIDTVLNQLSPEERAQLRQIFIKAGAAIKETKEDSSKNTR